MGRAPAAAVAGLLAGFALGFAVRGCTGDGSETRSLSGPPAAVGGAESAVSRSAPRRSRAVAEPLVASTADAATVDRTETAPDAAGRAEDVRSIPLDDAPTTWTDLAVQVVDREGRPVQGSRVRTSPPSERTGEYDYDARRDSGATADTDASGRCRLRLAAPATHDLRVHRGLWSLWRLGVVTPETRDVQIVDAPLEDLEVTTAEPLAPGERLSLALSAVPGQVEFVEAGTLVAPTSSAEWFELTAEAPARRWRLPTVLRWRVEGRETTAVEPVVARAGTVVRVRRAPGVLTIQARAHGDAWLRLGRRSLPVDVVTSGGSVPAYTIRVGTFVADGSSTGTASVAVDTPAGTVRWSGAEVEPGEEAYDLTASPTVRIAVRARGPAGGSEARVRLDVAPEAAVEDSSLDGEVGASSEAESGRRFAFDVGAETAIPGGDGEWAVVLPRPQREPEDACVAGPVRLRAGTCRTMTYAAGGFVLVAPLLPMDVGDVEVFRGDGAPLVVDGQVTDRADVHPGTILGPFPSGPVVLDVAVGEVRWARYEVRIRPGEHTILRIGPFGRSR